MRYLEETKTRNFNVNRKKTTKIPRGENEKMNQNDYNIERQKNKHNRLIIYLWIGKTSFLWRTKKKIITITENLNCMHGEKIPEKNYCNPKKIKEK